MGPRRLLPYRPVLLRILRLPARGIHRTRLHIRVRICFHLLRHSSAFKDISGCGQEAEADLARAQRARFRHRSGQI